MVGGGGEEAGEVGEAEPALVAMRLGGGVLVAGLGFSTCCFVEAPSFTSEMVRLVGGFWEAGLKVPDCFVDGPTGGRGLGMGFDLTVLGARFGRDGAARSSNLCSSLGLGMGFPELVSISRGSAKDTRDVFTLEAGVVGARVGIGGGGIDGGAKGGLALIALLLPLSGIGSGVVTGEALPSLLSSRELVLRRLVCLVMRPSDGGRA